MNPSRISHSPHRRRVSLGPPSTVVPVVLDLLKRATGRFRGVPPQESQRNDEEPTVDPECSPQPDTVEHRSSQLGSDRIRDQVCRKHQRCTE